METSQILEQAERDEIKFISLQFADLLGVIKEVVVPKGRLNEILTSGAWFDGSSIEGFARIQESDLFLKPDISTYAVVPWLTENGKTARFICDIYRPDGTPFEDDPRQILKKTLSEAESLGYSFNTGPEPEFYLFKKDFTSKTVPVDQGGYFDLSSYDGYAIMKEIMTALKSFNINPETSHHEVGQGQYEIDFQYGPALQTADRVLTMKYVIKQIAQRHGLIATFMPKPIMNIAGSGMHVHQSLFKDETNLFFDGTDKYGMSALAKSFIAGQLKNIPAMCAVLCPTVNSYKRLVSGFEAPVYITWAGMNRSALIRIPRWFKENPKAARAELRCPDPTTNPYLAFALMLASGLDGIKNNLIPPEPVEENVYQLDTNRLNDKNIKLLPTSLLEALGEMEKNEMIKKTLGEHLFVKYLDIKKQEWDEFKTQVTAWESEKYLTAY
ncbi:MAG: type I glutamate--ammonia ligase [Patescibacteria group bacterium]